MTSGRLLPYRHNRGLVYAQLAATVHPVSKGSRAAQPLSDGPELK